MAHPDPVVIQAIQSNPAALAVHRWWLALDALRVADAWVESDPHSKRAYDALDASKHQERYWANEVLRATNPANTFPPGGPE